MPIFSKPNRVRIIFLLTLFVNTSGYTQSVLLGHADSTFPVTNKFNVLYSVLSNLVYADAASAFSIASGHSTYYLLGNFTDIGPNNGSALVLDTATHSILSSRHSKINGLVNAAVPDGQGGFFVGGNFTRVGDSSCPYLAHLDSHGAPLSLPIQLDGIVNALLRKNDTLFIGGAFQTFNGKTQPYFAMYSLSGDSLFHAGGYGPFDFLTQINAFLVQNDTLIYGGIPTSGEAGIRKYDFKNNIYLPWVGQAPYQSIYTLGFNADSSVIVAGTEYNGQHILGLATGTGNQVYAMDNAYSQIKVAGNKAYVAGYFNTPRKGFFSFNASTGALSADDLGLDGYLSFVDVANGALFVSGKFSNILGSPRENFAALDTASMTLKNWQANPTDALNAIAFSGPNVFLTGYFGGINCIHRNGFAAIDSATNTILPWSPVNSNFSGGKRMIVRGDSVFVLGITGGASCAVDGYTASFAIYSISTGAQLYTNGPMDDFTIDSSYLYTSQSNQLKRYHLPDLTVDNTWGTNWNGAGGDHTPTWLIVRGDKVYGIGDNRYSGECTNLATRTGYAVVYDKATGYPINIYSYTGVNPEYDQIAFDHSLLVGNKLYITGYFSSLNGQARPNFVCIDVTTGAITPWTPSFAGSAIPSPGPGFTSPLKLYQGNIWFGSTGYANATTGSSFGGLGAVDTVNGNLVSPSFLNVKQQRGEDITFSYLKSDAVTDFLINDNRLAIAGSFDSLNQDPRTSLAVYTSISYAPTSLSFCENGSDSVTTNLPGTVYQWQLNKGNGFANIVNDSNFSGVNNPTLTLMNIPFAWNGFQLRCLSDAQIGKSFGLSLTPGILPLTTIAASTTNICVGDSVIFTAQVVNAGPNPVYSWQIDNVDAGVSTDTFTVNTLHNGDSVRMIVAANAACLIKTKDTSTAIAVTVNQIVVPTVTIADTTTSTPCPGTDQVFVAQTANGGSYPFRQWKWNGAPVGSNLDIYENANLSNGDSISLTLTSSATCAVPASINSNTIYVSLLTSLTPSITITGDTAVDSGGVASYTASTINPGTDPVYQWQDSLNNTGWKNIPGANGTTLSYTATRTGIGIRCELTSNAVCVSQPLVSSNTLSLDVHTISAIAVTTGQIRIYPNPATNQLTIDSLSASDGWQDLVIMGMDGRQEIGPIALNGQEKITVDIATLAPGIHFVALYRINGSPQYFKFVKL